MAKQEIINPYELSKDVKLNKQKTFYSMTIRRESPYFSRGEG